MDQEELKKRTKRFAAEIIRLVRSLPTGRIYYLLGDQLIRSGSSVGANYRAACRGRSRAEFIAKMGIVEEECDESIYWMELLSEAMQVNTQLLRDLVREGNEILAIVIASIKTSRAQLNARDRR